MRKKSWRERRDVDTYGRVPSCDREEMMENRRTTQGLSLLRMIEGDLNPSKFSLEEIRNSFNALVSIGGGDNVSTVRYGQSNLDWLVEKGFIAANEDGETYRVVRSIESLPSELSHLYPEEED